MIKATVYFLHGMSGNSLSRSNNMFHKKESRDICYPVELDGPTLQPQFVYPNPTRNVCKQSHTSQLSDLQ